MAKKRRTKKRRKIPRYLLLTTLTFTLLLVLSVIGFYIYELGFSQGRKVTSKNLTDFSTVKAKERQVLRSILSEVEDYKQSQKELPKTESKPPKLKEEKATKERRKPKVRSKERKKPTLAYEPKKPKLVIIIDDVAYGYQVRALRSLHLPVTLSFFPPSSRHPNTPRYAKQFRHYMIHLPLEAISFRREEEKTLRVSSDYAQIEKRIREIRRRFPRARFINNHTGSKFTADLSAMRRLISVLQRYDFVFVDSRTTAQTKAPKVMREFGYPYIHRDVFIDNELDVAHIKKQIKKAVRLAKRKGYAIAIGHPHKKTIEALRASKGVLKEVRLVYIDELFKDR
jgi:polysaccharide deacetylase 2 family uncharacterized protein YibQ